MIFSQSTRSTAFSCTNQALTAEPRFCEGFAFDLIAEENLPTVFTISLSLVYPLCPSKHGFRSPLSVMQAHPNTRCCVTVSCVHSAAQQLLFHSRDYSVCSFLNSRNESVGVALDFSGSCISLVAARLQAFSTIFTHTPLGLFLKPCQEPAPQLRDLDVSHGCPVTKRGGLSSM